MTPPKPLNLRQFAFAVAGPREVLIAGAINGGIAWLLFGCMDQVRLVGGHSLAVMLVPTAFLLPGLSSFFGVLAGALGRRAGAIAPPLAPDTPWIPLAVRVGLVRAVGIGGAATIALYLAYRWGVNFTCDGGLAAAAIALGTGAAAYGLHTTAILATRRLDALAPPATTRPPVR